MPRKLRVFLCHASQDKPAVRELYKRLATEAWIEPWLDEENLLPGQDFDLEIYRAARDTDAIIICLSKVSVAKEGYVNKEIRRALDAADEKPEGAIYIIPLRLDDCSPSFERLKKLHYADYFTQGAHERLLKSLRLRADALKIETSKSKVESFIEAISDTSNDVDLDLYKFIQIPAMEEMPYSFYIGKYPVTNAQYERFLKSPDFANPVYWLEFPKFDERCEKIDDSGKDGWNWLQKQFLDSKSSKVLLPVLWSDEDFGILHPYCPIVGISWHEASAYCEWLFQNWVSLIESKSNPLLQPQIVRLPLETEWVVSAGGVEPKGRYPWDEPGKETKSLKEVLRRANVLESGVGHTTPVNAYPLGRSPFGVMDMAGNVWEWQVNYSGQEYEGQKALGLRGGSWDCSEELARVSFRDFNSPYLRHDSVGFRVALFSSE